MPFSLLVVSYNCRSVKSSIYEISQLAKKADIILLQETWLFENELPLLSNISSEHYATGISAMDSSNGVITGRPHGGLAILWRKGISESCQVVKFEGESRLMGIKVIVNNSEHFIINCYMPYCSADNLPEFISPMLVRHTIPHLGWTMSYQP